MFFIPEYQPGDFFTAVLLTTDYASELFDDPSVVLKSCNIHCYGPASGAYYGNGLIVNGAVQSAATPQCGVITPSAVLFFENPLRLSSLFFKSFTSAAACVIVVEGVI